MEESVQKHGCDAETPLIFQIFSGVLDQLTVLEYDFLIMKTGKRKSRELYSGLLLLKNYSSI
jgi:hypothetical protein